MIVLLLVIFVKMKSSSELIETGLESLGFPDRSLHRLMVVIVAYRWPRVRFYGSPQLLLVNEAHLIVDGAALILERTILFDKVCFSRIFPQ